MAESVDALVSNTSGFTSMPVRSRLWVLKMPVNRPINGHLFFCPEMDLIEEQFCIWGFPRSFSEFVPCDMVIIKQDAESSVPHPVLFG